MLAVDGARCVFDTREIPNEVIDTISIDREVLDRDPTLVGRFHAAMAGAHRLSAGDPVRTERMMARGCGMTTEEFRSARAGIEVYGPEVQADWLRGGSRLRLLAERIGQELRVPTKGSDFVLAPGRSSPLLTPAAPR
jgi:NitT/TauT family transport system substrate-binding protein